MVCKASALGKRNYGTGEWSATMAATAAEASTRCQLADFGERVTNAIIERREERRAGGDGEGNPRSGRLRPLMGHNCFSIPFYCHDKGDRTREQDRMSND